MKKYTLAEVYRMDELRDEAAVRGVLAQIRTVVQQWADGDLFAAGAMSMIAKLLAEIDSDKRDSEGGGE